MCTSVGLYHRNTTYSFRRTALTEARREAGTELAKMLAILHPDSNTISVYDNEGLEDVGMSSFQIPVNTGFSGRIARWFSPVADS